MKRIHQYIPSFSKRFFEEYSDIDRLSRSSLFMCRQDGMLVYHNNGLGDQVDKNSVGALLGGIWQAAQALTNFLPNQDDMDSYRLSFDTSSQGVFIQPIIIEDVPYYLGLLYNNEINPAQIKSKLKILMINFKKYLDQEIDNLSDEFDSVKREDGFLFTDISDAEMDRLFAFAQK